MARPGPEGGQYQPLTEEQIRQIHQASLTVLEHTGIHVENEEALALYRQGGARVDGNRVHITQAMIEKAVEQRPGAVPRLSDLRESGSIEQDADLVIFLFPESDDSGDHGDAGPTRIVADVAKHRNGPVGRMTLDFIRNQGRFDEIGPRAY